MQLLAVRVALGACLPLLFPPASGYIPHPDLYAESDPLWVLTGQNLTSSVDANPGPIWLLQFYNTWCAHCQAFAPHYKRFAGEVLNWGKWVQVAVLDCAVHSNLPVCQAFDIVGTPTMVLIHRPQRVRMSLPGVRSTYDIKVGLLSVMETAQETLGEGWPDLRRFTGTDFPAGRATVAIFENETSWLGAETIVNNTLIKGLQVFRVSKSSSPLLYAKYNIPTDSTSPYLLVLDPEAETVVRRKLRGGLHEQRNMVDRSIDSVAGILDLNLTDRDEGGAALRQKAALALQLETEGAVSSEEPAVEVSAPRVFHVDIEKTLGYVLRHEVALTKELSGEKLDALRQFLGVIADYLPLRAPVKKFVESLNVFIGNVHRSSYPGEELQRFIEDHEARGDEEFLPDYADFKGCRGSQRVYRGYPCGLWVTFHTLTVNAANGTKEGEDPLRVLRAFRAYIKNFFGCRHCARNFEKMAAQDMEQYVDSPARSALWLWRGHNRVNQRVKGGPSEDPVHPKIVFPRAKDCSACYAGEGERSPDGSWNEEEVLEFLDGLYGAKRIDFEGTANNRV